MRGAWMVLVALACACTARRPARDAAELARKRRVFLERVQMEKEEGLERTLRRMTREMEEHGEPQPYDVLVLSGGGQYGAFAAGVLIGWGDRRPEFDAVTGISVGALIAPYAMLDDDGLYGELFETFRNAKAEWARSRGLFGLGGDAFFDNSKLKEDIRRIIDDEFVQRIAKEHEEDKTLLVGASNIDLGLIRVWDLGVEATRGATKYIQDVLIASSAIPLVFPPIEIEGDLYVDGAATALMFTGADQRAAERLADRWKQRFPDVSLPTVRYWVVVNNKITVDPETTQPRVVPIARRSFLTLSAAAMRHTLRGFRERFRLMDEVPGFSVEFRFVAIPDEFILPELDTEIFDEQAMKDLADVGRSLGADPKSWKTETPDPIWPDRER